MAEHDKQPTKYNVEIEDSHGVVVGDNAHVEQHFYGSATRSRPISREELLVAIHHVNADLRNYPYDIAGEHIDRIEVTQIIKWLQTANPKEHLGMVLDQAGSGKTVVMRDVLVQLEELQIPVLAIKADFLSGIQKRSDLAERLGIPLPVEDCAHHLAANGLFVVLLDQLDALSLSLSRDQATLDVMLRILAQLREQDNVRIVASCRTFDLHNDPRLSQLHVDATFPLHPLSDEQVDRVLMKLGVDGTNLLPGHRTLLTTPLHLQVYARVVTAGGLKQVPERFYTLQELYQALWQKLIDVTPPDAPRPGERIAAIYRLVEAMQNSRQINAPVAVLDEYPEAVTYLERIGFVHREGNNWLFFHQTLFDYCYARRFVAQGNVISQEILSGPQGLFERSQMIQVLAYLRGANRIAFRRELINLLFANALRTHLRLLLIGWFGSLPNPTTEELQIARRLMKNGDDWTRFIRAVGGNPGWFDLLNNELVPSWLQSQDETVVNLTVGYLATMISSRTEAVLARVRPYQGRSEVWDRHVTNCLGTLDHWQSENAIEMLSDLIARGRTFQQEGLHLQKLSTANPAAGCRILRIYLDWRLGNLLAHEAADQELEDAPRPGRRVRIYDRHSWEQYLLGEHAIGSIMKQAIQHCPEQIIEHVLPWFIRATETLSEARRGEDDYPIDPIFASYWYGDHLDEGATFAWQMTQVLSHLARLDSMAFRAIARQLQQVEALAVQRVLTHAYLSAPELYAGDIYDYLLADGRRLNIGEPMESPHYDSCRLFGVAFEKADSEKRMTLEQMILALKPGWEFQVRRSGITQLQFLTSVPFKLLSKTAQRRRRELENKFPGFALSTPQGVTGGWVGPPIDQHAQSKMSDEAWLGAMRRYGDRTAWDGPDEGFLKGGVIELSRSFTEQVKSNPERFYQLAKRFDETISLHYLSAAVSGLAESEAPAEWVFDLVRHFAPRLRDEFRRSVCWALTKRAEVGIPSDLLEMMAEWALHDPDPEQELWLVLANGEQPYYGGNPHEYGINTNRGAAIQAACHCALVRNPSEAEWAFSLLEQAADDPSTAVRTCIIERLEHLLNVDGSRTLIIFERSMAGHPVLLQNLLVHHFLWRAYYKHFPIIRPYIELLLQHPNNHARQAGARLACLAAFQYPDAEGLAEQALNLDVDARYGAAQVYAHNLESQKLREVCQERLLQLMNDPDEEVRKCVGTCFERLPPEDVDELRPFIEAFLNSPSLLLGAQHLIEYLSPVAADEPQLVLQLTRHILEKGGHEIANYHGSLALVDRDLVRLPLAVYTHAIDPQIKAQAMELFERLLVIGSYAANQALSEWDRR